MQRVFITGTAGFIGFHLADLLLKEGFIVHGYDALTDYYDVKLKEKRHAILKQNDNFTATKGLLEDVTSLDKAVEICSPDIIIHLAAQAGVRYSFENPRAYINANIIGTFNVMEAAKKQFVDHLLMASTSSVYGANEKMPYKETDKADTQMSFYAATKKATEAMAHSYAHLYDIPTSMFRFFTVYGTWSRPDMAPIKFTKAIMAGEPIDIYNHGEMFRDFTYVEDLVYGIRLLMDQIPQRPKSKEAIKDGDSLSPVAPYRIVNIGNSQKVRLLDFIDAIEAELGIKAIRNYMDMQPGDVPATWADASLLENLTGYKPQTEFQEGIKKFINWYKYYYK